MDPTAECDLWLQSDVTQLQCHGGCSAAVQVRCTWSAVSRPCSTLPRTAALYAAVCCTLHPAHRAHPPAATASSAAEPGPLRGRVRRAGPRHLGVRGVGRVAGGCRPKLHFDIAIVCRLRAGRGRVSGDEASLRAGGWGWISVAVLLHLLQTSPVIAMRWALPAPGPRTTGPHLQHRAAVPVPANCSFLLHLDLETLAHSSVRCPGLNTGLLPIIQWSNTSEGSEAWWPNNNIKPPHAGMSLLPPTT